MGSAEESMEILASFDLTGSLCAAADLAGCSHPTVARIVAERDAGSAPPRSWWPRLVDEFLPEIEDWGVETSKSRIRAEIAHDKLAALGSPGSERSCRRAAAAVKKRCRLGNARSTGPG